MVLKALSPDEDAIVSTHPPLLRHIITGGEFWPLVKNGVRPMRRRQWREQMEVLASMPPASAALAVRFHTHWHVCHEYLRQLLDDDALMIRLARAWLPAYKGEGLTLFRGENIERYESRRIGTAWSDQRRTAAMFASGWNSKGSGGVILMASVPAAAIIAGPSEHSRWLDEAEYTVDSRLLDGLTEIERFPASL